MLNPNAFSDKPALGTSRQA